MTYQIAKDLSIRIIKEEIFILKRSTSSIHSFNKTGTMIWNLLQEKKSYSEITQLLLVKFEIAGEIIENDLSEFLFSLSENQLIIMTA